MRTTITPRCKRDPSAFIEFTGLVTPCCWLVTSEKRVNRLKEFMGADFDKLFIEYSIEDIMLAYTKLEESWTTDNPFLTCVEVCGKK